MGFFSFDKEGPGVSKDAPKKKGMFLFFELLGRKFGKFCQINMLYFLISLPMILISIVAGKFFVEYASRILGFSNYSEHILFVTLTTFAAFMIVVLLGSGPASASLSYFYRAVVRESGIYLVSDFFEQFKKNFLQGITVGIINTVVTFIMLFVILFYGEIFLRTNSTFAFISMLIVFLACMIFVFSSYYIYQLMITFENTTFELYKNSIILALVNMPMNLLLSAIIFLINSWLFTPLNPAITGLLSFICWISVMRFIIEFFTSRMIQKKIISKIKTED